MFRVNPLPEFECIQLIRNSGSIMIKDDLNVPYQNEIKWTFLHKATQIGSIQLVEELLHRNASVNVVTNKGNSPMHIACKSLGKHKKYFDIFNILATTINCDFRIKNKQNEIALELIPSINLKKQCLAMLKSVTITPNIEWAIALLTLMTQTN